MVLNEKTMRTIEEIIIIENKEIDELLIKVRNAVTLLEFSIKLGEVKSNPLNDIYDRILRTISFGVINPIYKANVKTHLKQKLKEIKEQL